MKRKKSVLIIFKGGIGDFLILSPVLRALTESAKYTIDLLCNSEIKDLASNSKYFTACHFICYKKSLKQRFADIMAFLPLLKKEYDYVFTPICTHGRSVNLINQLFPRAHKIGFNHDLKKGIFDTEYRIDYTTTDLVQNLKLLDILNLSSDNIETELPISTSSYDKAYAVLKQNELIPKTKPIIAIAPFTRGIEGYARKNWSIDRYLQLIEELSINCNANIFLMGSDDELVLLENNNVFEQMPNVYLQEKGLSIADVGAILSHCALLICSDGGLMHVAVACKVHVLSIWGPTNPVRWGYNGNTKFIAIRNPLCPPCREYGVSANSCRIQRCLESISVEDVIKACKGILRTEALQLNNVAAASNRVF